MATRLILTLVLLLLSLVLFQGIAGDTFSTSLSSSSEEEEDLYLEKCCGLGTSWAKQKLRCEKFTGPVAGIPDEELPDCLEAVDICCRKHFQEEDCDQGKADAKAGLACTRDATGPRRAPVGLGDSRRDCCEGCKLGINTGSSGKSCTAKKFSLGAPWDPAFMECCLEVTSGTTKPATSISTNAITSASTSSSTPEFDPFEDLEDSSDLGNSTFSSGDLCQLLKGLLCSEICVPTPGSYICKCRDGSKILEDGRTCQSKTTTKLSTTITSSPSRATKASTTTAKAKTSTTSATTTTTTITTTKQPKTTKAAKKTTKPAKVTITAKPSTTTTAKKTTTTVAPKKAQTKALTTLAKKATTKATTAGVKTTKPVSQPPTVILRNLVSRTTRSLSTENNELNLCPTGYRYNATSESCDDIDECAVSSHNCGTQKCFNLPGSFQCAKAAVPVPKRKTTAALTTPFKRHQENCAKGSRYSNERNECIDINECEELEDACASTEKCVNNIGSFTCSCLPGFRRDEMTQACVDINECQLENDCLPSQRCDNTIGSYTCVRFLPCGTGYTLNAATEICEDDDECLLGTHDCTAGYHCRNTLGSYRCDKNRGPPGITTTTKRPIARITTLRTTTTIAPSTTTARSQTTTRKANEVVTVPTVGTIRTTMKSPGTNDTNSKPRECPPGFESGPIGQCIDVDECHRNLRMCGTLRCVNTIGSFRCEPRVMCGIGYSVDSVTGACKDVDECADGSHKCGPGQKCENRPGGYVCFCPLGFEVGANRQCVDVNECLRVSDLCGKHGECINTPGSYRCECQKGFSSGQSGSPSCRDIDECAREPGLCQHECHNTWGGHECSCRPGYRLKSDNRTCDDIDECTEFKENNLCVGICDNTPGSYKCSCPKGYLLASDTRTCQDIDECATGNTCSSNELCQNLRGGFRCNAINCPTGYIRDPQRKNRCVRESPYCPVNDPSCFQRPAHYTYNYIAIVSMYPIPATTGQVELFTMRGAYQLAGSTVTFGLTFINARAPPHVQPATEHYFALRRPFPSQAVLVMTRSLQGPQDIELEFSMEIYGPDGAFAGSAIAKVFIIVTQYEF